MNEHKFPTIQDAVAVLSHLAKDGYGDLPIQIIVAPDSTIQALAQAAGNPAAEPATMLEYVCEEGRYPVGLICAARLRGDGMASLKKN